LAAAGDHPPRLRDHDRAHRFHSAPRPDDLAEIAPDGIELGYGIDLPFRRKGYAREAALALMRWAYDGVGQRCFVLSVSPQNLPSTAMAHALGFTPCGSHIDDEDGLEIEFIRRFTQWPPDWESPCLLR
jgi:RimJ/RimL family protein N-acetyltransferase